MTIISTTAGRNPSKKGSSHHGQQKSPKCSTWMQSQKRQNDLCLQSKQFNITVIQIYAPNSNTEEGNGKPLQYSCLENPMNSMKRKTDRIPKEELPRSLCAQNATGDQWRNKSRKNEETEPQQKQYPVVDVTGDGSKVNAVKSTTA